MFVVQNLLQISEIIFSSFFRKISVESFLENDIQNNIGSFLENDMKNIGSFLENEMQSANPPSIPSKSGLIWFLLSKDA